MEANIDALMKHYQLIVEEEHYFFSEHHKRIAYFSSFITSILVATIAGFVAAEKWYHFFLLTAGPISIIAISRIAQVGIRRIYQRFLETITVRAKLEERLAYASDPAPGSDEEMGWARTEPLITKRHSRSRNETKYRSSKEWVDAHLEKKENYHGVSIRLFNTFIILAIFGLIALIAIGTIQMVSGDFQMLFG